MSDALYPLKFEPIFKEKPWGGRHIERLGLTLPGDPATRIGEAWLVVDLGATMSSNPTGKAERSVIANGAAQGRTLHDLIHELGPELLGRVEPTEDAGFPLLVKFLDARETLSVQVHPSRAYAATHPGTYVKYEAWYIIEADPGAVIYKGLHEWVMPAAIRAALEAKDEKAILSMLIAVPVKAGDCHYIPSGTPHALGAGIVVAEVQTPSDTTFRLYDFKRSRMDAIEQQWHIEQGMRCIAYGPPNVRHIETRSHVAGFFTTVSSLILCDYFHIEKVRMTEGYEQEIPYDQPVVWVVLEGKGKITTAAGHTVDFQRGEAMLVPANMNHGRVSLEQNTTWLEVSFPKAKQQLLA